MAEASSPKTPEKTVEGSMADLALAPRKMNTGRVCPISSTNLWIMLSASFIYPVNAYAVTTLTRSTGGQVEYRGQ